jgi:hypothetical protein
MVEVLCGYNLNLQLVDTIQATHILTQPLEKAERRIGSWREVKQKNDSKFYHLFKDGETHIKGKEIQVASGRIDFSPNNQQGCTVSNLKWNFPPIFQKEAQPG